MEKGKCLDFIGNSNYAVSDLGNVKNVATNLYLKQWDNHGYKRVVIFNTIYNGKFYKQRYFQVSWLVATAFIPNPDGKTEVDHIDGSRSNNVATNLKGVTHKENMNNPITVDRRNTSEMKKRFGGPTGRHWKLINGKRVWY